MRELKTDLAYLKAKTVEAFVIEAKEEAPPIPRGVVECFGECKLTDMDSLIKFGQEAKKMKPQNDGEAKLEQHVKSLPNAKAKMDFLSKFYLELREESKMSKQAGGDSVRREINRLMREDRARYFAKMRGEPFDEKKFRKNSPEVELFSMSQEDYEKSMKRRPDSLVGEFFLGIPNFKRLRFYIAALCLLHYGVSVSTVFGAVIAGFYATPFVMAIIMFGVTLLREFVHTNKIMLWLCKNLRFVANKMFDVVEGIVSGVYKTFGGDTSKVEAAFERAKIAFMG